MHEVIELEAEPMVADGATINVRVGLLFRRMADSLWRCRARNPNARHCAHSRF